jgi:hypothetical protein
MLRLYDSLLTPLPRFGGMVYQDGNVLELPHSEGTPGEIQTTYPCPGDVFGRAAPPSPKRLSSTVRA